MDQVQQRILRRGASVAAFLALLAPAFPAQKFYPDDPMAREPKPLTLPDARNRVINEYFDYFQNTFFEPVSRYKRKTEGNTVGSQAVNTLGEVPDSAWFTNRMGSKRMTREELVRGPITSRGPVAPWTVLSGKNEGVTPGMLIKDHNGDRYLLKFDPKSNPEMATAADVIGSKFFYALGYNVPENSIVHFERGQVKADPKAKYRTPSGTDRPMVEADIDDILAKVPKTDDGGYRALASRIIGGEVIGPFRFYGTRADDPNDFVPHENRRDLRGLFVFDAWMNHTDAKSINTLDSVVEEGPLRFIKHFLIDFGASLGSDSFEAKSPRAGHVYLYSLKPSAAQFLSLGLYVPAWMRADYPKIPAVGHLDYETFEPDQWHTNYPIPSFDQRNPGDTWWAAKKVMAFSDHDIRAMVATGEFTDPRAPEWISRCLIERRNRIGREYFGRVLPLDGFAVNGGKLEFQDLGARYGFSKPREYNIRWFEFDNASGGKTPIAQASGATVPRSQAAYLAAQIDGDEPRKTVMVYLRGGSRVVGVDHTW